MNEGEQYEVDELDPALASRFLSVNVVADVSEWVAWARDNGVDESIVEFVSNTPEVFDDIHSNPRSWEYASDLLKVWREWNEEEWLLSVSLGGQLDEVWALAFLEYLKGQCRPLSAKDI